MKILIVDDEAPARRRLRRLLEELSEPDIVGEARDGEEARDCIERLRPDAVFLDIHMPRLDGLTLAARACSLPPIVFVTAYDEFAVRAFEIGAVDYLLKPIRSERLELTLARLRASSRARPDHAASQVVSALATRSGVPPAARIVCVSQDQLQIFDAREITRFWSSDKYTLFRGKGAEQLTSESLTVLETRLQPFGFMRVHRGELVNLAHAQTLVLTQGEATLRLSDGQELSVSRRRVAAVKAALAAGG